MLWFYWRRSKTEGRSKRLRRTFGVDWSHLLAQIISFSIVCVLLHRFAYKPVLNMLEERRQQIAQGATQHREDNRRISPD